MSITIQPVASLSDLAELIRFHKALAEMKAAPMPFRLPAARPGMHLLVRRHGSAGAVAALSVMETTDDRAVHEQYGLHFPAGAGVARYAWLAAGPGSRRLNLFARLIEEAGRLFVDRHKIRYTWLELDAASARGSGFHTLLGYQLQPAIIHSASGPRRVLVRDEWSPGSGTLRTAATTPTP